MNSKLPVTVADTARRSLNGESGRLVMPHSQLIFCTEGGGELICENSLPSLFGAGDVIFIAPSVLHGFRAENAELMLVLASGTYIRSVSDYFDFGYSCVIGGCGELEAIFKELLGEAAQALDDDTDISSALYELIVRCGIIRLRSRPAYSVEGFIAGAAEAYLTENYSKPDFSFEPLVKELGIPRSELDAVLKKRTGSDADGCYMRFRLEVMRTLEYLRPHLDFDRCAMTNGFKSYEEYKRAREEVPAAPLRF